jgi:hypothetical protein
VASSTAGLLLYVREDRVYCVFCKEALKATTISTLTNHCTLRQNKKRPAAAAGAGAGGAGAGAKRKQRTARMLCKHEINVQNALEAKAKKAKLLAGLGAVVSEKKNGSGASNKDLALNLRGSLTGVCMAHGMIPAQLEKLMTREASSALQFITIYSEFGGAGTRKEDAKRMKMRVVERIKEILKVDSDAPIYVTACLDGASTDFGGGQSCSALIVDSTRLKKPILLGTTWAGGSCDAEHYVEFFNQVRELYGMSVDQFIALMGDCVTLNDKIARLLGLTRLKCLSHIMALICHAIYGSFPGLEDFLRGMHTIFTAGGSHKRANEASDSKYVKLGMDVQAVRQLLLTRWGTANELLHALVANECAMLTKALPAFRREAKSMQNYVVDAVGEQVLENADGLGIAAIAAQAAASDAVRRELSMSVAEPDTNVRGAAARALRYIER